MKQMLPHIGFIFKRNIRDKKNIYYIYFVCFIMKYHSIFHLFSHFSFLKYQFLVKIYIFLPTILSYLYTSFPFFC